MAATRSVLDCAHAGAAVPPQRSRQVVTSLIPTRAFAIPVSFVLKKPVRNCIPHLRHPAGWLLTVKAGKTALPAAAETTDRTNGARFLVPTLCVGTRASDALRRETG